MCIRVLSHLSHVQLFATLWTIAHQAPLSMGFSRQEYWRGLPCPLPGDLPNPGVEPPSLMFPALADRLFTTSNNREAPGKGILAWKGRLGEGRVLGHRWVPFCLEKCPLFTRFCTDSVSQ